jgi:hypothetical protein
MEMVSDLPGEPLSVTHAKRDSGSGVQKTPAAELSRVGRDGETANSGFRYADTRCGMANCKMTAAVFGLSDAKPEPDFISLVVEAALETIPHSR